MNLKNTISIKEQDIFISFNKRGENFTLDVPHKYRWIELMKFLTKRGWKVESDKDIDRLIRKTYKVAIKRDMFLKLELTPMCIHVTMDLIINKFDHSSNIRPIYHHDKYVKPNYIQHCHIELEKFKISQLVKSWGHELKINDSDLSPIEYILNKEAINTHIHGGPVTLQGIKDSIKEDSYNYQYNSNDMNDKKIICGQKKYFYRNGRLHCGYAWHNINNMWWVLFGQEKTNQACFNLFDINKNIPRKELPSKSKLESIMNKFYKKRDFRRAQAVFNHGIDIGVFEYESEQEY